MKFRSCESKITEGCGEGGREHWPPCAAARLARLDPPAARGGLEGGELSSAAGFSPAGHRRCPGALGTQASLPGGVAILSPLSLSVMSCRGLGQHLCVGGQAPSSPSSPGVRGCRALLCVVLTSSAHNGKRALTPPSPHTPSPHPPPQLPSTPLLLTSLRVEAKG